MHATPLESVREYARPTCRLVTFWSRPWPRSSATSEALPSFSRAWLHDRYIIEPCHLLHHLQPKDSRRPPPRAGVAQPSHPAFRPISRHQAPDRRPRQPHSVIRDPARGDPGALYRDLPQSCVYALSIWTGLTSSDSSLRPASVHTWTGIRTNFIASILHSTSTPQCLSDNEPRPSSAADGRATASPKPTPQTRTSAGLAMSTSPASPCRDPNIASRPRRNTRSTWSPSASPTPGAARASRANTLPWAPVHPADCPARRLAGVAAGTAARRVSPTRVAEA